MFSSQNWSIERMVVLVSPLFAALAAVLTAWLTKHFPGAPKIDKTGVSSLMITAFVGAIGLVLKWLHGRQKPAVASGLVKNPTAALAIETATAGPPGPAGAPGAQGPPGVAGEPGVTPEQVRALVKDEVAHLSLTVAPATQA